ncbi:hypothetical protein GCM10020000_15330 [Streptomyces olivoverticillatus]
MIWWAYPLAGPGPERLLMLAADAGALPVEESRRIAPAFAPHTDFPDATLLAGRLPDILPNMGPAACGRIAAQVLELGYPVLEISRHERIPVTHDWGTPRHAGRRSRVPAADALATEVRAAGEPDLEHAAVRERLEFLNEVSKGIGTSLDLERTIREVTSAAVPRFTDFAGTHLRAAVLAGEGFPDGPPDVTTVWHRVSVEHNDEPGRWDDTVPVGEAIAFPEHTPFFQCMVTGEPVLIPRITEELGNRISERFEKRDLRPLINGRSMLVVPLKARHVVLGFMVLMRREGREPFDDMDRTTGAELAARAGLVLDNARMYTYQENVADTLQDSMLPQLTPRTAGCDTATRYLPGTRLGRVGGDWFDSIKLPGSRTALVVGDVMGHGLHSAAMMGQLRTAVQTMAALDLPPERLLRNLDDLAQRLGEHYLATCLYAVYDPIRSELRIANAGHIPPVLVRAADGRSELLQLPTGAPIGVGGVPFEAAAVPVAPRRPAGAVHRRTGGGPRPGHRGGAGGPVRVGRPPGRLHGRRLRHHHPRPQQRRRPQGRRGPADGPAQRHPGRTRGGVAARARAPGGRPRPPPGPGAAGRLGAGGRGADHGGARRRTGRQRRASRPDPVGGAAAGAHRRAAVRGHGRRPHPPGAVGQRPRRGVGARAAGGERHGTGVGRQPYGARQDGVVRAGAGAPPLTSGSAASPDHDRIASNVTLDMASFFVQRFARRHAYAARGGGVGPGDAHFAVLPGCEDALVAARSFRRPEARILAHS